MVVQQIEDIIYKVPIVILFAVPVLLVLMLAAGPLWRRVRYNRGGLALVAIALAAAVYVIVIRFNGLR